MLIAGLISRPFKRRIRPSLQTVTRSTLRTRPSLDTRIQARRHRAIIQSSVRCIGLVKWQVRQHAATNLYFFLDPFTQLFTVFPPFFFVPLLVAAPACFLQPLALLPVVGLHWLWHALTGYRWSKGVSQLEMSGIGIGCTRFALRGFRAMAFTSR